MNDRTLFNKKKAVIEYPCNWIFKLIGTDRKELDSAIKEILPDRTFTVSESKTSKKGNYISLNLEIQINDEKERLGLYKKLQEHNSVKIVL